MAVIAKGVAGLVYAIAAPVNWLAVLLLMAAVPAAVRSDRCARRIPAGPLRLGITAVAIVVAVLRPW